MERSTRTIELFLRSCNAWVVFALLLQVPDLFVLWTFPPAPDLIGSSWLSMALSPYSYMPKYALIIGNVILMTCALWNSITVPSWWRMALVWWLYGAWMNASWPTSTSGHQLMANAFLWGVPLALGAGATRTPTIALIAFHVLRLQLLLAYVTTVMHKLMGTTWLDGTALFLLATDRSWGLSWTVEWPMMARLLTWAVIAFQTLFVFAVWWRPTRRLFLIFGLVFHMITAYLFHIPEMGAAFIVYYVLWIQMGGSTWSSGSVGLGTRLSASMEHVRT